MKHPKMKQSASLLFCLALWPLALGGEPQATQAPEPQVPEPLAPAAAALRAAFMQEGLTLDLRQGWLSLPGTVCVRQDLLEYVLVAAHGAAHESLFATSVNATVLNTAFVTLGAQSGENVRWLPRDPQPTSEEVRGGAPTHTVLAPTGDGFLPYVAWTEKDEVYFYRLEDLIQNLKSERAMQRHAWIYLGSRMVQDGDGALTLAAELEGNLINISYFRAGNTLFTASLEACVEQTIWLPNASLIPPQGSRVRLIFSKSRLRSLPRDIEYSLKAAMEGTLDR
jgi:hypothetical protein